MLVLVAVALTFAVSVLSAYMRLSASGFGCSDWPGCYGRALLGHVGESTVPAWMHAVHRLAAGLLGLVIVTLNMPGLRPREASWTVSGLMLALTVALAALGLISTGSYRSLIVAGNLLGGVALVALAWWLWLAPGARRLSERDGLAWLTLGALGIGLALVSGAWVSAQLAAVACQGPDGCSPRAVLDGLDGMMGLLPPPESGALFAPARQALQVVHGVVGALGLALAAVLGLRAWRLRVRNSGGLLVLTAVAVGGTGVGLVIAAPPLGLALAHNVLGTLLLMALLGVVARRGGIERGKVRRRSIHAHR